MAEEERMSDISEDNDPEGYLLHQAVWYNNAELLESLLQGDEKQHIDSRGSDDQTLLYKAVRKQRVECCHLLLEAGANPNAQCGPNAASQTPLHCAARNNNAQLVALLLEHGARWFICDSTGNTAVELAQAHNAHDSEHIINTYACDREAQLLKACEKADAETARRLIPELPDQAVAKILNVRSGDSHNSFLHRACEAGDVAMTSLILAHNNDDSGVHSVTGQSPLHAACSHGHAECVTLILKKFPELIQAPTIDGLLPIHEACSEGHLDIIKLLFTFPYPEVIVKTFKEQNGCRMYRLGLGINAKDGHGRTPLHIACLRGRPQIVRELLQFKTPVTSKYQEGSFRSKPRRTTVKHSTKRLSRSEGGGMRMFEDAQESVTEASCDDELNGEEIIRPVEADIDSIDLDGNTALHVAVRNNSTPHGHQIAESLLQYGANPNKPIISPSGNLSPLMMACSREDVEMVNILLKHGAKDPDNKVLAQAIGVQNEDIIGVFLQHKNHVDTNYRVNAAKLYEIFRMCRPGSMSVSWCNATVNLRHIWPNSAISLDWRGLGLLSISLPWLTEACKLHNKRRTALNVDVPKDELALYAITRIDIADNELTKLPLEMFKLPSLRVFNAANNQIDWIPGCPISVPRSCSCLGGILRNHGDSSSPPCSPTCVHKTANEESVQALDDMWDCPVLEEINFQSNKLNSLPKALCRLPTIKKLNLSFNKITSLPSELWLSKSLSELNVSHNVLKQLCGSETRQMISHNEETIDLSLAQDSLVASPRSSMQLAQQAKADTEMINLKIPGYQAGFRQIQINQVSHWSDSLNIHESSHASKSSKISTSCKLIELNASHNFLSAVPEGLACMTPHLETLNISHNKLRSLGAPHMYPGSLRELDVSYNELEEMMREELLEGSGDSGYHSVSVCYSPLARANRPIARGTCRHRSHNDMERLKTLKLSHNKLKRLCMTTDARGFESSITRSPVKETRKGSASSASSDVRLFFPNVSVLDAGYNELQHLSSNIALHVHLSELKLQYNSFLNELPAELGLLRKLWNLNMTGCRVRDHLQALLGREATRTVAVLGYLKSIKEEATPYNRMKLMFVGIQGIGKTSLLHALRRQGKSSNKNTKTWGQRMGHSSIQGRDQKGENISTVGVDIGDLQFESDGVVFSTWDFGGQREYYATHQYFLSRRSLYLVCWNIQDGEKGVAQIMQWLVNIQARAPNSPVLIVGTHLDMITDQHYSRDYVSDLRKLIWRKYIGQPEPEKSGLPRVMGAIEVSTKPSFFRKNYVSELKAMIMEAVRSAANEKGVNLLTQKVPAIYVQLEEVVRQLAHERKVQHKDPVLHAEQYKSLVLSEMERRYKNSFRDLSELNQATQFLHENGVLLHYDDVNLQEAYFLDPQWLCDILANVVTIREINGYARAGIMRTDELKLLFKNAAFKPDDIKAYVINLLSKFEVALLWDDTNLLIPSMLPSEEEVRRNLHHARVMVPVKGSSRRVDTPTVPVIHSSLQLNPTDSHSSPSHPGLNDINHLFTRSEKPGIARRGSQTSMDSLDKFRTHSNSSSPARAKRVDTLSLPSPGVSSMNNNGSFIGGDTPLITCITNPASCLVRLYLMSYFPSGFWPRFITRLLGDTSFYDTALSMYELPELLKANDEFLSTADACPMWQCWQSGVRLDYLGACLLRVKEVGREDTTAFCDYRQCRIHVEQQDLGPVNVRATSILEILLPNEALSVAFEKMPLATSMTDSMFMNLVIHPNQKVIASLLNKVVDHIDTLLEDWYPDLGARFVQNSKGMYLITRLVPCIRCLVIQTEIQNKRLETNDAWSLVDINPKDLSPTVSKPILVNQNSNLSTSGEAVEARMRSSESTGSFESRGRGNKRQGRCFKEGEVNLAALSKSEKILQPPPKARIRSAADFANSVPKGVGMGGASKQSEPKSRRKAATVDTPANQKSQNQWNGYLAYFNLTANTYAQGHTNEGHTQGQSESSLSHACTVHCYLVEQCMQAAQSNKIVYCPVHGSLGPYFIASETGRVTLGHIAPDTVFQDMGDDYLIDCDLITRGRFLGKGAFGAVYAGTMLDKGSGEQVEIAMKMMQPVPPDSDAPHSVHLQYKQEKVKWTKEPMKFSCEAYLNVRKELSILLTLQHPHIVSLLGVSTHPLCLVLSLAPQGSLNSRLEEYRRKGVKMPVYAIHLIIKQVASALAYLHSNKIIYRDLKSENVLVWQLASPEDPDSCDVMDVSETVEVKLADYGVSRSVLPWGTRGLAGTPPFMAPEIIQHNGEETYTEKVDCYSFGMFIYELLTQRTPFDSAVTTQGVGRFNRDSYIVSGGRPAISYQECIYPSYLLDLMATCWSHDPNSRPSANQIIELAEWAEFTQLCDTLSLPEYHNVTAAVAVPHIPPLLQQNWEVMETVIAEEDEEEEEEKCDVWMSLTPDSGADLPASLAVYTYSVHGCLQAKQRPLRNIEITVMCATAEHVWCADSKSTVHVFSLTTLEEVTQFPVNSGSKSGHIQTMVYGANSKTVYVFLNNGLKSRFVICSADLPSSGNSPVTNECPGNGKLIHSVALLYHNEAEELWCGHSNQKAGEVSIWSLGAGRGVRTVAHDKDKDSRTVHLTVTDTACSAVWTYVYPGTEVYRWNVYTRQVTHVVDLAHVVPKSPSPLLAKHVTSDFFIASKCQVVTMCTYGDCMYVGSTLGCITVLDKHTLAALSIVQCNTDEHKVNFLLPLVFASPHIPDADTISNCSSGESVQEQSQAQVLSTCRGHLDVTSHVMPRYDVMRSQRSRHYMSTWRTQGWYTSAKIPFRGCGDDTIYE